MKKLVVGLVVLAAVTVYWLRSAERSGLVVRIAPVQRGDVIASVSNTRAGTVDACRRAGITPASGGNITALYVDDGDEVAEGQLLLELWNADLKAQLTLAQRDADAAKALSRQACVTAEVARHTASRLQTLQKTHVASRDAVEKAVGEADSAEAACVAAREAIKVKQAAVQAAEAAVQRTQLYAPFAGVVAEINGELGEFVTPSPVGVATPPSIDLIDNSCLYILAPIDEVDAPQVQAGMDAWVSLDAFKGRRFAGRVQRVAPYVLDVEKQSRTVDVEAVIEDPDMQVLLPGYSADVEIIIGESKSVLYVPTSAITEQSMVYVIPAQGGRIEQREVTTGLRNWQQTEITAGLSDGEFVVRSIDRDGVEDGAQATVEQ